MDMNKDNVCQLPISSLANDANDIGMPLSLVRPDEAVNELLALQQLARIVSRELFLLPYRQTQADEGQVVFESNGEMFPISTLQLSSDDDSLVVRAFSESGALQKRFSPEELRNRDPKTGQPLEVPDEEPKNSDERSMVTVYKSKSRKSPTKVVPEKIEKKAKIGFEVAWSDGAKFIYSRRAIALAAGGVLTK
jgi:hypothetical protein